VCVCVCVWEGRRPFFCAVLSTLRSISALLCSDPILSYLPLILPPAFRLYSRVPHPASPLHTPLSLPLVPFFQRPHAQASTSQCNYLVPSPWPKDRCCLGVRPSPVTLHTPTADYARARRTITIHLTIIQPRPRPLFAWSLLQPIFALSRPPHRSSIRTRPRTLSSRFRAARPNCCNSNPAAYHATPIRQASPAPLQLKAALSSIINS
jgi:hypothetical protein